MKLTDWLVRALVVVTFVGLLVSPGEWDFGLVLACFAVVGSWAMLYPIYVPTDQSLMAETYEGDLGDILKIQREVAKSISGEVRVKLTPQQESRCIV